jgi:hypothetical protein
VHNNDPWPRSQQDLAESEQGPLHTSQSPSRNGATAGPAEDLGGLISDEDEISWLDWGNKDDSTSTEDDEEDDEEEGIEEEAEDHPFLSADSGFSSSGFSSIRLPERTYVRRRTFEARNSAPWKYVRPSLIATRKSTDEVRNDIAKVLASLAISKRATQFGFRCSDSRYANPVKNWHLDWTTLKCVFTIGLVMNRAIDGHVIDLRIKLINKEPVPSGIFDMFRLNCRKILTRLHAYPGYVCFDTEYDSDETRYEGEL